MEIIISLKFLIQYKKNEENSDYEIKKKLFYK